MFRINFFHADYDNVKERIKIIRALNEKHNIHTSILADLQGPKLRVGEIEEGTVAAMWTPLHFLLKLSWGTAPRPT